MPAGRRADRLAACLLAAASVLLHVAALAQTSPSGGAPAQTAPSAPTPAPVPSETAPSPIAPVPGPQPAPPLPSSRPLPPGTVAPEGVPEAPPTAPPPGRVPSVAAPILAIPQPGAGPLFELHPSIGVSEEFTSNFSRTRDGDANLRTSVSPGLALLINGISARGAVSYGLASAFDHASGETNLFQSLAGLVTWQATPRLGFSVSDTFTRTDEPEQADRLSLRRERGLFTSNVLSLGADYRIDTVATAERYTLATFFDDAGRDTVTHTLALSAGTRLGATNTASAGYEFTSSSTSGVGGSDLTGHVLSGSLARAVNPLVGVGVAGSLGLRTVRASIGPERDVTLWNVSVFNNYTLPTWSTRGNVGFSRLSDGAGVEQSSISTVSTLTYRFARAVATVSADSGFSETFLLGENRGVVDTRGITASLSYPVPPNIGTDVSLFYRTNDFTGVAGGEGDRSETVWGGTLAVSVRMRRWLTGRFDYAYSARESSRRDDSVVEHRVRLSLDAAF